MGVLLVLSAMVSGAEVAFFSLGPQEFKDLENSKEKSDQLILKLLERPKRLLATILITNNLVNVAIIIISTTITDLIFNFSNNPKLGFTIQVLAVTFIILLLGEVIPKVYANTYGLRLAKIMSFPIKGLDSLFASIKLNTFLVNSTSFIERKMRKKNTEINVDELSHAIELTKEDGTSEEEQKMLKGIVKFGNTDVKQIMKSRVDVTAFELQTPFNELIEEILKSGYSRIPVYTENFDKVEGILYVKDLLPHIDKPENFTWQPLIRTPFFVPESKKIDDLLKEFQDKKIHLAIVVDEYGGTSGIVTLEDVIEEIVGDITDEFDEDDLSYSKIDDFNYVFEGKTPLNDIYRVLEIEGKKFEDIKGDSDTLAGLILELAGKIPKKNERITFENYVFTVEAADRRRVKQVKITISSLLNDNE